MDKQNITSPKKLNKNNNIQEINNEIQFQKRYDYLLLLYLTAFWSINEQENRKGQYKGKNKPILRLPHASQIIAIMFLLGFEENDGMINIKKLTKKLIQIGTGEGKSIVLGLLAAFLALVKYNVDVVCYSKILSQRDWNEFKDFYKNLNIEKQIRYATFIQLSESLINQNGDIRIMSKELIKPEGIQQNEFSQEVKHILLIDEVDVFFNTDFYGQTYTPIFQFKDEDISVIMDNIWNSRENKGEDIIRDVQATNEYENLIKKYPKIQQLINQHIQQMVDAVKQIDTHQFFIKSKNKQGHITSKIGKKVHDRISTHCYEGYITNFAYFKEICQHSLQITEDQKKDNTCMNIICGFYSYAEVPHLYNCIIGVTGTLSQLNQECLSIIQQYDIKKMYKIPTMFTPKKQKIEQGIPRIFNKEFGRDIFIFDEIDSQLNKIKEITLEKVNKKRAVLIFFNSQQNKEDLVKLGIHTKIIDQNMHKLDYQDIVMNATKSQQVVLVDRIFGRGTDFITYDPDVLAENGGVVIIQTFFSNDKSEEIQIKGRTGRQGQGGEFYLILNKIQLMEEFLFSEEELNQIESQNIYKEILNVRRYQMWGTIIQDMKECYQEAQLKHKITLEFKQCLKNKNEEKSIELLTQFNQIIKSYETFHYILCLDNSASMWIQKWKDLCQAVESFITKKIENDADKQTNQFFINGLRKSRDYFSVILYSKIATVQAEYKIFDKQNSNEIINNLKQNKQFLDATLFYTGVEQIYKLLENEPLQCKKNKKIIIFLTDGEDQEDSEKLGQNLSKLLQLLKEKYQNKIKAFWTMGFGYQAQNCVILEEMAKFMSDQGGRYVQVLDSQLLEQEFINLSITYL